MRLHHASTVCLSVAGALVSGVLLANAVTEQSFQLRFDSATLVVTATASSTETDSSKSEYSVLKVDSVLKGDAPSIIRVLTKGSISEFDPRCCAVGSRYLLLLQRVEGGYYVTVNGQFGAYLLSTKR